MIEPRRLSRRRQYTAVVVNGVHQDRAYRLSDADVLSLFSMAAFSSEEPQG